MAGPLGTRKGLKDYLVLLSIQQTCKYRGIGFLDFLKSGNKNLEEFTDSHFQRKRGSVTQASQEQATPDIALSKVTKLPYVETQSQGKPRSSDDGEFHADSNLQNLASELQEPQQNHINLLEPFGNEEQSYGSEASLDQHASLIVKKRAKERTKRRNHIPLFPETITEITTTLTFSNNEGQVTYYQNALPVFTHKEDDMASFRMIISQFCVNKIVKQAQIANAFGISLRMVKLSVKKYREYGPPGFYAQKKLRGAAVLTEPVMIEAQRLLDKGFSVKMIAVRMGLKYDTVSKAVGAGRLHF